MFTAQRETRAARSAGASPRGCAAAAHCPPGVGSVSPRQISCASAWPEQSRLRCPASCARQEVAERRRSLERFDERHRSSSTPRRRRHRHVEPPLGIVSGWTAATCTSGGSVASSWLNRLGPRKRAPIDQRFASRAASATRPRAAGSMLARTRPACGSSSVGAALAPFHFAVQLAYARRAQRHQPRYVEQRHRRTTMPRRDERDVHGPLVVERPRREIRAQHQAAPLRAAAGRRAAPACRAAPARRRCDRSTRPPRADRRVSTACASRSSSLRRTRSTSAAAARRRPRRAGEHHPREPARRCSRSS